MNRALSRIELFLLPAGTKKAEQRGEDDEPVEKDVNHAPIHRLDDLLFQVALADYIRVMQTMYRDSHDDQNLASELRGEGGQTAKLPIKHLMGKIVEGRSRALPLLKLCCGENSVAVLKGCIEAASAYALQGQWPQVEEKILSANSTLKNISRVISVQSSDAQIKLSLAAAERVECVFRQLRAHAIRNNGQVLAAFVKEIMVALVQLPSHIEDKNDPLGHPSKFAAALHIYFTSHRDKKSAVKYPGYSASYFDQSQQSHQSQPKTESKSWGDVVDFLRQCGPMKAWMEALGRGMLPQDRAALCLPFRFCDLQQRNIAHPIQLSHTLLSFPAAARVVTGTKLPKLLAQIKVEVPVFIDPRTGSLLDFKQMQQMQQLRQHGFDNGGPSQQVFYELPITLEEFLAIFLLASRPSVQSQVSLLRVQLCTIQGVCSIYTGHLDAAEDFLKKALNMLEQLGLEMEIVACELYNSIAQMMIMRHRKWVAGKKSRLREEAALWLDGDEGQKEVKAQVKLIRKQYSAKSYPVSGGEIDLRARNNAARKRVGTTSRQLDDSKAMNKTLEASYRYLVRSFEILENTHGSQHPAVGTACLAVASVQNILEDHEDTRDWLMRALRYMEKYRPLPHRAISFTQIQLSQVLCKLGHDDQARMVLSNAAAFHRGRAQQGLTAHQNPARLVMGAGLSHEQRPETGDGLGGMGGDNYSMVSPPIMPNSPLYEEIQSALDIMGKVMRMSTKCYDKWQAATQAEEIARLTDQAFGWDSFQAADAFKQVGIRCAAVADWARACKYLKGSLEAMALLFGKMDFRTISVAKLLHSARKARGGAGGLEFEGDLSAQAGEDSPRGFENSSPTAVLDRDNDVFTGGVGARRKTSNTGPDSPGPLEADADMGPASMLS